jgi:hypothetical protein
MKNCKVSLNFEIFKELGLPEDAILKYYNINNRTGEIDIYFYSEDPTDKYKPLEDYI